MNISYSGQREYFRFAHHLDSLERRALRSDAEPSQEEIGRHNTLSELFMNYFISPGREFADGRRIRGHRIRGHFPNSPDFGKCPPCFEFGAICEFSSRKK